MLRGLYTATSGMVTESLRTDVIANNLANVNTVGYKKMKRLVPNLKPYC